MQKNKPIVLSFFSGAMGLDLGLEQAGYDVRSCCENDKNAIATIQTNRPSVTLFTDISGLSAETILAKIGITAQDVFLIAGGPPCQAFSTAGKRRSFMDARGNVFLKYLEIATEIRPPYILVENVRGLLSAPLSPSERLPGCVEDLEGGALWHVLEYFESKGYVVSFNLYNTANFGVPQCRERVILIASREGRTVPHLTPTHSNDSEWRHRHGLLTWKTFREATRGLDESSAHYLKFSDKHLEFYKNLGPGQNWRDLPLELQQLAMGKSFHSGGGRTGFYRRLAWDQPSPTLVTSPAMPATALGHPERNRPLSIEEYKRLQCFPDEWQICGALRDQYKQVGNAVPVQFGAAVGRAILRHYQGEIDVLMSGFPYSRYHDTDEVSWRAKIRSIREEFQSLDKRMKYKKQRF